MLPLMKQLISIIRPIKRTAFRIKTQTNLARTIKVWLDKAEKTILQEGDLAKSGGKRTA
jgi:hypothetical protein